MQKKFAKFFLRNQTISRPPINGYREQLSVILSTSAIEITVDVPPNRFTIAQISKFNVATCPSSSLSIHPVRLVASGCSKLERLQPEAAEQ